MLLSHVDYGNAIFATPPGRIHGPKLQRLLNAVHDDLHWLDVPERVEYKIGITVHRCLQYKAPNSWSTLTLQSRTLPADTTYVQLVDII